MKSRYGVKGFVALMVVLVSTLLLSVAVASADPTTGSNSFVIPDVSCDNGFQGTVLVPAGPAVAAFNFSYPVDGPAEAVALARGRTIRVGSFDGTIVQQDDLPGAPGKGYDTVTCQFVIPADPPLFPTTLYVEIEAQWVERGN